MESDRQSLEAERTQMDSNGAWRLYDRNPWSGQGANLLGSRTANSPSLGVVEPERGGMGSLTSCGRREQQTRRCNVIHLEVSYMTYGAAGRLRLRHSMQTAVRHYADLRTGRGQKAAQEAWETPLVKVKDPGV